jgi:dolichyl-phosphate beta-glucosyltransferase
MMNVTLDYLTTRKSRDPTFTWEIIVVDDGSKDNTCKVVRGYADTNPEIRLLRQPKNMGKGAAIQAGSLHARGELILMVDADGASKISDLEKLEAKVREDGSANRERVAVGSRTEKGQREPLRKFLGLGFHGLIWLAGVRGISDTQCGFKLFTREAARVLFPNQHVQCWCFDPELLLIAQRRKMLVYEVPIEWNEIGGSKMKVKSMIRMATDLLRIAVFHRVGAWTIGAKTLGPDHAGL